LFSGKKNNFMKQFLFVLSVSVIVLSAGVSKAQTLKTIQNGDFEAWDSTSFEDLIPPWQTTNAQDYGIYNQATVTKVTGQSGSAVHVQTYLIGQDTVSGSMILTIPATQKPTTLTGYYRSNIAGHDTAFIYVGFEQAGNTLTVQSFQVISSVKSFTPFTINIPAFSGTPDTMAIVVSMTNLFDSLAISISTPGSWIEVDQLAFSGNGTNLQIPDGNFDSWTTNTLYNPVGWEAVPAFYGNNNNGVSKSTNHYSGKYSVKMVAQPFSFLPQLTNGKFLSNQYGSSVVGGTPFNLSADTLTGYYEYMPSGLDTGVIAILCENSGNLIGGNFYSFLAAPTWTYFEVPLSLTTAPDTMMVNISATNNFNGTAGPSTLYLDDLQLKSQPHTAGISNSLKNNFGVSAFPDPAKDQLNIRFEGNVPGEFGLKIFNSEGRLMIDNQFNSGISSITIPIDQLSAGLYFYEINANGSSVRNKFVKSN